MSRDARSAAANIVLAVGTALALAIGIGFAFFYRDSSHNAPVAPAPIEAPAPTQNTDHGTVFVPLPVRPAMPAPVGTKPDSIAPPPADAPAATPTPTPPGVSSPDKSQNDTPSDLKKVELQPHEVHAVPDTDEPMRPVTLMSQDGRVLGVERERAGPPSSYVPSAGPGSAPSTTFARERGVSSGYVPSVGPGSEPGMKFPRAEHTASALSGKATKVAASPGLTGTAIVTDVNELNVGGHPLRLFGVKAPEAWDVCSPDPHYAARACPEVSRDILASRLKGKGVSCRLMPSSTSSAYPALCQDGSGTDLGAYLVSQGFALADARESGNYANAESAARSAHLGLWHYR